MSGSTSQTGGCRATRASIRSIPIGPSEVLAFRFSRPEIGAQKVVKGGSWLCAPTFCMRYRPAARQPTEQGIGSNHIGFRIARDGE
jgi:sulfatase modifying factor 1